MNIDEKTEKTEIFLKELSEYTTNGEFNRVKRVCETLLKKDLPFESIEGFILKTILKGKSPQKASTKFSESANKIAKSMIQIEEVIQRNYTKVPSETIISIILSLPEDFQPIIIEIEETADALFNREKLTYENEYAKKATEIWLPLATKIGMSDSEWKIQDFAFKVINPQGFETVKKLINKKREEREALIEEVREEIKKLLEGKITATIVGRPKSFKSIFDKLKKTAFEKMHDIYGIRIICEKEKDCYEALGMVHFKYEIIPEAFDDYISKPKNDGYKSIHTAVQRKNDAIEIQIRTWAQHLRITGESYWNYKHMAKNNEFEKELSWERQLLEWQKQNGKERTNKKTVGDKLFVFTPKNDAISLPKGATVIDFAFAVHTEIGRKAEKAKVNGLFVPLETKLNNLDTVEIIANEKTQMKKNWLQNAVTEKAKSKIKTFFGLFKKKEPKKTLMSMNNAKKIKMAECCHPLPGEDVVGVKTTKRKIIVHKKDCQNISKISKDRLVTIDFEREKGETGVRVKAVDRPGLLGEVLEEIKNSGATLKNTSFKIKKNEYADAMFILEIKNAQKLEKLIEKINNIPSVQLAERI